MFRLPRISNSASSKSENYFTLDSDGPEINVSNRERLPLQLAIPVNDALLGSAGRSLEVGQTSIDLVSLKRPVSSIWGERAVEIQVLRTLGSKSM
jgi:hypothetical protein